MCTRCELAEAVTRGEAVLSQFDGVYRRPLTAIELAYGDVPRVRKDFDDAAVDIAQGAGPVVRKMAEQMAREALALAKTKDVAGIARVTPSFVGELSAALKRGIASALDRGKAQVLDQYAHQTGSRFELLLPRRKQLKKTTAYLAARADVESERISGIVAATVRATTLGQVARNVSDEWIRDALDYENPDSILSRAILGGENALIGTATAQAREAIGLGRLFGLDEVRDQVESVTYTAVLDDNVCDVCASLDGEEYTADEAGKAPNDDCIGAQYGNECRCYEVYVFLKD